jgi:predicted nucleic acid-binding protein
LEIFWRAIFVDANTFIYAFAPDPAFGPPCYQLFERIKRKEINGVTSSHVLSNAAHRLMSLEACAAFGWPIAGVANRLKRHAAQIAQLHRFRQALDEIVAIGVQIVSISAQHVLSAGDLSRRHGLLSGDALIIAAMQSQNLTKLATNDSDFDLFPGIIRYAPL